jgi:hypothetical protein
MRVISTSPIFQVRMVAMDIIPPVCAARVTRIHCTVAAAGALSKLLSLLHTLGADSS